MTRLPALLLALAACGPQDTAQAAPQMLAGSAAGDDVLGTIEATIDGTRMTWHVVAAEVRGMPYASALWFRPDDDRVVIGIGGFDTPTPPFDSFETGQDGAAVSFGEYDGPVFTISLATGPEPAPYRRTFPNDGDLTALVYLAEARFDDMTLMFMQSSGSVDVTTLELVDGEIRAEGTFSGQMGNPGGEGRRVQVTDGRFSVRGVPHRDRLTGG